MHEGMRVLLRELTLVASVAHAALALLDLWAPPTFDGVALLRLGHALLGLVAL